MRQCKYLVNECWMENCIKKRRNGIFVHLHAFAVQRAVCANKWPVWKILFPIPIHIWSLFRWIPRSIRQTIHWLFVLRCFNCITCALVWCLAKAQISTMVYRWLYTYCPIFCIEFRGGSRGGGAGGPGPPLSENLDIDFYSGFRLFFHVYTFIVASEKKIIRGGVQFEIPRNPGIDFYSGFKKKIQV